MFNCQIKCSQAALVVLFVITSCTVTPAVVTYDGEMALVEQRDSYSSQDLSASSADEGSNEFNHVVDNRNGKVVESASVDCQEYQEAINSMKDDLTTCYSKQRRLFDGALKIKNQKAELEELMTETEVKFNGCDIEKSEMEKVLKETEGRLTECDTAKSRLIQKTTDQWNKMEQMSVESESKLKECDAEKSSLIQKTTDQNNKMEQMLAESESKLKECDTRRKIMIQEASSQKHKLEEKISNMKKTESSLHKALGKCSKMEEVMVDIENRLEKCSGETKRLVHEASDRNSKMEQLLMESESKLSKMKRKMEDKITGVEDKLFGALQGQDRIFKRAKDIKIFLEEKVFRLKVSEKRLLAALGACTQREVEKLKIGQIAIEKQNRIVQDIQKAMYEWKENTSRQVQSAQHSLARCQESQFSRSQLLKSVSEKATGMEIMLSECSAELDINLKLVLEQQEEIVTLQKEIESLREGQQYGMIVYQPPYFFGDVSVMQIIFLTVNILGLAIIIKILNEKHHNTSSKNCYTVSADATNNDGDAPPVCSAVRTRSSTRLRKARSCATKSK